MKHYLFLILFFVSTTALIATDWVTVQSGAPAPAQIQLIQSGISQSTVQFTLDGFWKQAVETDRGTAWLVSLDDGAEILKQSAPALPLFASSLIVPNRAAMKVEVVSSEFIEIQDVLIAPSKGNLSRQVDPAIIPFEFGKIYGRSGDYPGSLARLNDPYIVRDYRGQTLIFQPFQYNPVTRTLKVYYNITVSVSENGTSDINILDQDQPPQMINRPFDGIYARHFLNYGSNLRYTPVSEEGKMIVISYADFIDEIQPLATWKNKKGIPCNVVNVADIGGSSAIKQYIQNAYDDGNVTFVLLVGDAAQVPSSSVQGNDSDNNYTYVAGNDHYPDLFIGRFSAQSETDVTTMVNRTLAYEIDPPADTSWYCKAIGIASSEGPGDNNELDYQHIRNISNNKLLPFTYNYAYELFEGSQGGNDAPGNPSPSMVADAVNAGATIINYTGHGSTTSWGTSGFSSNNVNSLTNTGKWPFIISVACVNGNFVNSTCFAEAWLRATDNGQPTGAIATLMSTINQSWNPPMRGQDEMNDILTEAYADNIKRTFGGITMNGCMAMNDAYGSGGWQETDCWTIFGDPSLVIRTAIPADMTVNHPDSIIMGQTSLTLTCDAEGGLAVLSRNGAILGTAVVVDGEATIGLHPLGIVDTMDIVVTAFNHKPYMGTVRILPDNEPYITYAGNTINDIYGNQNGLLDYAEEIELTLDITNLGHDTANAVTVTLSTLNPHITFMADNVEYGSIAAGDTISVTDGFAFNLAENVPDGEIIEFTVTAEDMAGRSVWESGFDLEAHAPELIYVNYSIDDANGDGNGKLDAGETVDLIVEIANQGSSEAYNLSGLLTVEGGRIEIENEMQQVGDLEGGLNAHLIYTVTADADTPEGYSALFYFNLSADHDITESGEFFTVIGQIPVLVVNFSEASAVTDSIAACMNLLHVGADYATVLPENPDVYKSIFVILGVYPDNYALTSQQGELLAAYLENGGSMYMEGGDAWAYDEQTAVHQLFNIEGLEDGSDDLTFIIGEAGGFLDGYRFAYGGVNNYIDKIAAKNGATLLLSNETPYYGVAVSYENMVYRTIGASISFAGLTDSETGEKASAMAEILSFFDVGYVWTDVNENETVEIECSAFPNPFSSQVTIAFSLREQNEVSLDIFDLTGRKVITLVDIELPQGNHQFTWDAIGPGSVKMQPGIYFYRIKYKNQTTTKKLLLTQ